MAAKIKNQKWFRWHDAGDVQSVEHMAKDLGGCKVNTKHAPLVTNPGAPIPTGPERRA